MLINSLWSFEKSTNLYYRAFRKKDSTRAIIFLHGLGASHNYWDSVYHKLQDSLYFVDLLGFGYSKKPNGVYTLSRHVQALRNFIKKEVAEKSVIFIGHSLGALIALGYTHLYPSNVKQLFLLALPYYHSEAEANRMLKSLHVWPSLFTDTFAAHMSCHLVCTFRPAFMMLVPLLVWDLPKKVVGDAFLHTHSSYFSTMKYVIMQQNIPRLLGPTIRSKIILIHAKDDKTVPFRNAESLASKYSLKLIALQSGHHNFPLTSKKKIITILNKYVN